MCSGEPIPRIEYTPAEEAVWSAVLTQLADLLPAHACAEYLRCLPLFDFSPDRVPQVCVVGCACFGGGGCVLMRHRLPLSAAAAAAPAAVSASRHARPARLPNQPSTPSLPPRPRRSWRI